MRRFLAIAVLMMASVAAYAAMSDSSAMSMAQSIWGPNAYIAKARLFGDGNWTMQVGCMDSTRKAFIVAGQALGTWDAAFAVVNMPANGPHTLTAVATDTAGNTATSSPVQVYACNPPPLTITLPAVLPGAEVGISYTQPLTATGGTPPYNWIVIGAQNAGFGPSPLPPGVIQQGNSLQGTPTTAGTYNFTLSVSDALNLVATLPVSLTMTIAGQEEDEW